MDDHWKKFSKGIGSQMPSMKLNLNSGRVGVETKKKTSMGRMVGIFSGTTHYILPS